LVAATARPGKTLDLLSLDGGLVPDGLVRGWHGWEGIHTGSGYSGLLTEAARGNPDAVRVFDYDWRLSNRHTAALLKAKVESWLGEWRERTGDRTARVCFLCHSMGGLIVRYYLEVLGGGETAARVLTLGTPHSGSVKAVRALTGDAFARVPFFGDRITELVRTFPSVGQLLPTYRCVDGTRTLAEVPVPDLPSTIVADGLAFHAEIAAAVARNGPQPYAMHVLAGARNETLQSLTVTGGQVEYLSEQRGTDHRGDGTVALFAAVPPDWADTSVAEIYAVRHAALGDAEATMLAVRNKLSPIDLGDTLHPAVELGIGLPDITEADRPFDVRAHSDRDDVLLHATAVDLSSGNVVAASRMRPLGDGSYAATLTAPAGLWRVDVTAVAETPPISTADLVLCG